MFYSECACSQGDRDWQHVKLRTWGPEKILNSKVLFDSYRAGSLLEVEFSSCLKADWMECWAPTKTYQSQHSRSGFLKHFVLWQSDKACGLLRFLRIVKETNYTEKRSNSSLRVGMKSPLKNITMVFISPWKPLHSRSLLFDVWCFELLIWTAGAMKMEGNLMVGSDIPCSPPPEYLQILSIYPEMRPRSLGFGWPSEAGLGHAVICILKNWSR